MNGNIILILQNKEYIKNPEPINTSQTSVKATLSKVPPLLSVNNAPSLKTCANLGGSKAVQRSAGQVSSVTPRVTHAVLPPRQDQDCAWGSFMCVISSIDK